MKNKMKLVLLFMGVMGIVTSQSCVIVRDCVFWRHSRVARAVNTWFRLSGSLGGRFLGS